MRSMQHRRSYDADVGTGTEVGGAAAPLDDAVGLTRGRDDGEWTILNLRPQPVALAAGEPVAYVHGGVLATCVDTAAWEAVVREHDGTWVASDLRIDFLRLARDEEHLVRARVRRVGRRQALVDVDITSTADPQRLVAVGRAAFTRTG